MRKSWIALVAITLALALVVAGCGSKSSNSSGGGSSSATLTGNDIAAKSTEAMKAIKSVTVGFDLTANVAIDAAKADAQTKALVGAPITVSGTLKGGGEGKDAKVDVALKLNAGKEKLDAGIKVDGTNGWIGLMGQWYALPPGSLSQVAPSASPGSSASADITAQLKTLGIDVNTLITGRDLVGTEQLDGKDVYHVTDKVDTAALATTLATLVQSASALGGAVGASTSPTTAQDAAAAAKALQSAIKNVSIDTWYEKDTLYMRKIVVKATLDFTTDPQAATTGLKTADINATITMGDFDAPVTVTPPAKVLPFEQLMQGLGTLTGGLTGTGQ
jgi:hypothetical protein